jgi:hypothetical protein
MADPQEFVKALYQPLHGDLEVIGQFIGQYGQQLEPLQKAIGDKERAVKWTDIFAALKGYKQFMETSAQNPALQQYIQQGSIQQQVASLLEGFQHLYYADMTQLEYGRYQLEQRLQQTQQIIATSEQARQQAGLF